MKLVIISGRSGSGKSVVLQTLEDLHYYCVDNLPPSLLPALLEELALHQTSVAVSLDARSLEKNTQDLFSILENLKQRYDCRLVFVDADNRTLLQRFKETRRRHPLTNSEVSLKEALSRETLLLAPLLELADLKLDTSQMTSPNLRDLTIRYLHQKEENRLAVLLESFGYKWGVPLEADLIFDARCLPNPYWDKKLRNKTGLDKAVIRFFLDQPLCQEMLDDIYSYLVKWLPLYQAEHRKYLTIAIGCTGGQHRSVYLVNQLSQRLGCADYVITVRHRDLS